jgi:hypothetical protein
MMKNINRIKKTKKIYNKNKRGGTNAYNERTELVPFKTPDGEMRLIQKLAEKDYTQGKIKPYNFLMDLVPYTGKYNEKKKEGEMLLVTENTTTNIKKPPPPIIKKKSPTIIKKKPAPPIIKKPQKKPIKPVPVPSALAPVKPIKFILSNVKPAAPAPAPNAPAPGPNAPVTAAPAVTAGVASPDEKPFYDVGASPYYSLGDVENENTYANVPGNAAVPARRLMENANYVQGSESKAAAAPAAEFREARPSTSSEYQEVGPSAEFGPNCNDPTVMPWLVYLKDFDVDTDNLDVNQNKQTYLAYYKKMEGYKNDNSCDVSIKPEVGSFFNEIKKIPKNKNLGIPEYYRLKAIQKFINEKNNYYENCKTQIINEIKFDDIKNLTSEQIKLLKTNYNDVNKLTPEMKDYVVNKRKQFTELSKIKNINVDYIKRFFESFPEFNKDDKVKYVKTEYHGQWSNKEQSYDSETTYEYNGTITNVDTKYNDEKYENNYTIQTTTLKKDNEEVKKYEVIFTSKNSGADDKITLITGAIKGGSMKKKRITKRKKKHATKKKNTYTFGKSIKKHLKKKYF